jgi:hypothetical protein
MQDAAVKRASHGRGSQKNNFLTGDGIDRHNSIFNEHAADGRCTWYRLNAGVQSLIPIITELSGKLVTHASGPAGA